MNQRTAKFNPEIEQHLDILRPMNDNQLIMAALSMIISKMAGDEDNVAAAFIYELQRRAMGMEEVKDV